MNTVVPETETDPGQINPSGIPMTNPRVFSRFHRLIAFFAVFGLASFLLHRLICFGLTAVSDGEMGALNNAMSGKVNAEILISGSSRAMGHYDPMVLKTVIGKSTFNLGRNASHTDFQLAMLKAYLAQNRAPDILIQNLDIHSFEPTEEIYEPAQYVPYLAEPAFYDALLSINPQVWKWRYVPLYAFAVEDMKLVWLRSLKAPFVRKASPNLGFFPSNRPWTGEFDSFKARHPEGISRRIEPKGVTALRHIAALCNQNSIRLIFVYSPELLEAQQLTVNREAIFEQFSALAAEAGAAFWDFSDSEICTDRTLFYNSQHLNTQGAALFSAELAARVAGEVSSGLELQGLSNARAGH